MKLSKGTLIALGEYLSTWDCSAEEAIDIMSREADKNLSSVEDNKLSVWEPHEHSTPEWLLEQIERLGGEIDTAIAVGETDMLRCMLRDKELKKQKLD